ncbi:UvrD-helicase domain-containing protein [Clostridium perfringens]|uniref:UvrD-helicase domain-containing protein n=1 Tax=Clostridium perfringens TaxID=1502 RepID=UPI0011240C39|nr:UvrD-helicase domain-containing protein [Clostridium perfringens]MDK0678008.1 UvrD-helicase domain-containing protein [Clostridium perfringens]MDM0909651.1 UvrD-helicase domain-containing protein [Clostridium perfringens]TPE20056.1 ATP-dependent helicase [Clostridium perfringens]
MINNFDNIEITEDDIKYAEKILFGKSGVFDIEERRPIIENFNESFDVNACPGSGKSTVLIAKLIILSRKMPLKSGQGVCVLTHTNVAINEIKDKLGEKSDILFKYPNYIGTIQSFVNKYLAIPFFKNITGKDIISIDNDSFDNYLRKLSKCYFPEIQNAINYSIKKGLKIYSYGKDTENFVKFISGKYFKIVDGNIFISNKSGSTLENMRYYKELSQIMYGGVLRYNDAYILADGYLSKFECLSRYFSKRFKYVFIDEMQDTNIIQSEILKKIFKPEEGAIVQRFGDINQRIGLSKEESGWVLSDNTKAINSSKRYGNEIIKFLQPLRILKIGYMVGNKDINTFNPHIIIFNNNSIKKVINKFIDVIKEYNINNFKGKIKVIGKIGINVESPNLSIKSYTDIYKNNNKKYSSNKFYYKLICSKNLKEFYDNIISSIILSLEFDKKKVSKNNFIKYMQLEKDEEFLFYKSNIKKWFCDIKVNTEQVINNIIEVTSSLLSELENYKFKKKVLEEIFLIPKEEIMVSEEIAATEEGNNEYIIEDINTVFGVKGETHLATLYLESKLIKNGKNIRSDIMKILDYMLDKRKKIDKEDEEALIAAYVAMSRAEKLTCIAISYDTIKGRINEFREYGYKIIACDKEIQELIDKES